MNTATQTTNLNISTPENRGVFQAAAIMGWADATYYDGTTGYAIPVLMPHGITCNVVGAETKAGKAIISPRKKHLKGCYNGHNCLLQIDQKWKRDAVNAPFSRHQPHCHQ